MCNFRHYNFSCPTGMELVAPPTRSDNYTLRTADEPQGDSSGDPTTYTPGVLNELHLRVAHHAWKYIGLLLYAVRADAGALDEDENLIEEPIGEWDVRADPDDFYVSPACGRLAVTHMSAKPKRMHHRFHWKPPVGLGRVTFRLLIKWCCRAPWQRRSGWWLHARPRRAARRRQRRRWAQRGRRRWSSRCVRCGC